ncbi:hypothetical protein V8F06_012977 [Rhypophila decipiens]
MALLKLSLGVSLPKLAALLVIGNAFFIAAEDIALPDIQRRDHTTSTITLTTTAAPITTTVNPRDPTITWKPPGWTVTVALPDHTQVITSPGCLTYSFISPPADHPTSASTVTVTVRDTVTITNPSRLPLTTQTIFPTPTVTLTTPRGTVISVHCTNTLVVSYYDRPDAPATYTFSVWQSTSFITGLCKSTTTRTTTIPGVVLPTTTIQDWEYFSSGSTLATKYSIAILDLTQLTFPGVTTSTRCDPSLNPSPAITTTTVRFNRQSTTTITTKVPDPSACVKPAVNRREADSFDQELAARQVTASPIEIRTVVYTTVTVIDNTIRTLTGTAIVDVVTQSFPRTSIVWTTLTGTETVKVTSRVCPTPAL